MFFDGHWMPAVHGLGWWWLVLLLLAVVVGLLVGAQRRDGGTRETPRQVLQRRLATGEITPQEYDERVARLDAGSGTAEPGVRH